MNIKKNFILCFVLFTLLFNFLFIKIISANNIDTTVYSEQTNNFVDVADTDDEPATVGIEDIQESSDLSVTNMINIVLISIGIVLILLGIAIIIKLK